MSDMLSRALAKLGRVTRWAQTSYPSPNSVTMFKQCSSTRDPPFPGNRMLNHLAQFAIVTGWIRNNAFTIHPSPRTPFKKPSLKYHVPTTAQYPKQCSSLGDPLPPSSKNHKELQERVVHLTCQSSAPLGHCDVFLVGMLYGSTRSRSNIQEIINTLKPEVVFLEASVCELETEMKKELGKQDPDLCAAYNEALKCGATLIPGDIPMTITEERVWRKMPLSERLNLLSIPFRKVRFWRLNQLSRKLEEELDSGGKIDMETITSLNQKLFEISPTFVETYIHERDLYMSAVLLEEAKKRRCIVAVVGLSHLPGIKKHWKQPVKNITLQDLVRVPPIPTYFKCAGVLPSIAVPCVFATMLNCLMSGYV